MKKFIFGSLFISAILVIYFFTPVRNYLSKESFGELQVWIQSQGVFAPLVFGLIYIAAVVFALPGSILTILGGILFGVLWGTLINWLSAGIGAMISFIVARYLGSDVVSKFLKKQESLKGLHDTIDNIGFHSVFILRLIPLFPFNVLNFGLGLSKVSFRDYAFATLLGILPGSFVYTSLGSAGNHISLSDPATFMQMKVWGPFVLILLLSLLPKFFKKRA